MCRRDRGNVVADGGELRLQASQQVRISDTAQLVAKGQIEVTARQGLRLTDADGNAVSGTYGRGTGAAAGVLRIVGDQTVATNQALALRLLGRNSFDRLEVTGKLNMAGTLDVKIPAFSEDKAFAPQLGEVFGLITAHRLRCSGAAAQGLFG